MGRVNNLCFPCSMRAAPPGHFNCHTLSIVPVSVFTVVLAILFVGGPVSSPCKKPSVHRASSIEYRSTTKQIDADSFSAYAFCPLVKIFCIVSLCLLPSLAEFQFALPSAALLVGSNRDTNSSIPSNASLNKEGKYWQSIVSFSGVSPIGLRHRLRDSNKTVSQQPQTYQQSNTSAFLATTATGHSVASRGNPKECSAILGTELSLRERSTLGKASVRGNVLVVAGAQHGDAGRICLRAARSSAGWNSLPAEARQGVAAQTHFFNKRHHHGIGESTAHSDKKIDSSVQSHAGTQSRNSSGCRLQLVVQPLVLSPAARASVGKEVKKIQDTMTKESARDLVVGACSRLLRAKEGSVSRKKSGQLPLHATPSLSTVRAHKLQAQPEMTAAAVVAQAHKKLQSSRSTSSSSRHGSTNWKLPYKHQQGVGGGGGGSRAEDRSFVSEKNTAEFEEDETAESEDDEAIDSEGDETGGSGTDESTGEEDEEEDLEEDDEGEYEPMSPKGPLDSNNYGEVWLPVQCRPRRNRKSPAVRQLLKEHVVKPSSFIYPLFVHDEELSVPIASMPGQKRLSVRDLVKEIGECRAYGVNAFMIFPKVDPSLKTNMGEESYNPEGLIPRAIAAIKDSYPDVLVLADVALDPYSSHGQDGVVEEDTGKVVNDITVHQLCKQAVTLARAGADMVCPSDMMDGRVSAIREALDMEGCVDTSILSYACKYASSFYGPFRDALDSHVRTGCDKRTYQMDYSNVIEAEREAELDTMEGADILMVKPGLPYLDVLCRLRKTSRLPLAAYHVSGEYAMLKAAAANKVIDERAAVLEVLKSFRRAGAQAVATYYAKEAAQWMANDHKHEHIFTEPSY